MIVDRKIKGVLLSIFTLVLFSWSGVAFSADLKVVTNKTNYQVGDIVSARIILSSADQSVNAVSGTLKFPTDKLEVTSLSKSGSVINLWVQEPDFSNSTGEVSFEGAILNPGFTGASGQSLSVNFKAKKAGTATISFSTGSILANDGQGSSILKKLGQTSVTIGSTKAVIEPAIEVEKPVEVETTIAPKKETKNQYPDVPSIVSLTNPDQSLWYSINYPQLSWTLPEDVTDVSLIFDNKEKTIPPTKSQGLFSSYVDGKSVADGNWYFHLRFKNKIGWGPVGHYKLNIDTKEPERFEVNEVKLGQGSAGARFVFDGTDALSGIDHFEFQVDDSEPQIINADSVKTFDTPDLRAGRHILTARVIDRAGNLVVRKLTFAIDPELTGSFAVRVGDNLILVLSVLVPLIILLMALIYILLISWKKLSTIKRRLRKEVREAEDGLHQAFDLIKEDLQVQMELLKKAKTKRKLTAIETKIMKNIKADLNEAEKFIKNEIEDISKQI